MSTEGNTAVVRRFFEEVCNGRNLAVADELFTASHAYHDPFIPTGPGPEGMQQVIAPYHAAFSDARWTVDEMINAGDTIEIEFNNLGRAKFAVKGNSPRKDAEWLPGKNQPTPPPGGGMHKV